MSFDPSPFALQVLLDFIKQINDDQGYAYTFPEISYSLPIHGFCLTTVNLLKIMSNIWWFTTHFVVF